MGNGTATHTAGGADRGQLATRALYAGGVIDLIEVGTSVRTSAFRTRMPSRTALKKSFVVGAAGGEGSDAGGTGAGVGRKEVVLF